MTSVSPCRLSQRFVDDELSGGVAELPRGLERQPDRRAATILRSSGGVGETGMARSAVWS